MKQLSRIEKQVAQRKTFVRGRRGLNTQMLLLSRAVYGYLLEVNKYLTQTGETMEERFSAQQELREAGEQLKEEVQQWLAGE